MANNRGGSRIGGQLAVHLGNLLDLLKTVHGTGSGLDSDLVDGKHVDDTKTDANSLWTASKINSQFATSMRRLSAPVTRDCNDFVDYNGFFVWDTTTNTFNNTPKGNLAQGSGQVFMVQNYTPDNSTSKILQECTFFYPNGSIDKYFRAYNGTTWSNWSKIWHDGNMGAGSGLNADTVDGLEASVFMRNDQDNSLTDKKLTITSTGNVAPLELKGATAGLGSGLLLNNTTVTTGKKYSIYSGSAGQLAITDETASAIRLTISSAGDISAGGDITGKILKSSVAQGTAPLNVVSTTVVPNLNVDMLDGYHAALVSTISTVAVRDASGNLTSKAFIADVAQGTAPLTITSTTKVNNLNVDLLDGMHADTASTASTVAARDASGNLTAKVFISDVAQGTAPLSVISTTKVANLNVDTVDGYHLNQGVQTTDSPTFSKLTLSMADGTAPMVITSKTVVPNLNVDYLDGYHASDLLKSDVNSEQVISGSEIRVQSTNSTERFGIEFNETEGCLDFIYYTA